jgi:hypothetical protein
MSGLARAAVEGDERALDLFSSWRPKVVFFTFFLLKIYLQFFD